VTTVTETTFDRSTCASCQHTIDASARLCPYCGANPQTGQRVVDTQAVMQEVFRPRELTTSASVIEYARQRQGIVIAITAFVAFLILAAFHQFVTMRNSTAVTDSPAVPLSEVTELTRKADEMAPVAMPKLDFPYEGRPQAMRTYIVEPGAVKPPAPLPAPAPAPPAAPAPTTR
jgi:hypothetical protein